MVPSRARVRPIRRAAGFAMTAALGLSVAAAGQSNYSPLPTVVRITTSGCLGIQQTLSGANLYPGPGGPGSGLQVGTTPTITAAWPASVGPAATVMVLGIPTGNLTLDSSTRQPWASFMTFCSGGPCLMHHVGFDGNEFNLTLVVGAGDSLSVPLPLPNSPALLAWAGQYRLGFQALHADLVNGCWDMSYAYALFIVP